MPKHLRTSNIKYQGYLRPWLPVIVKQYNSGRTVPEIARSLYDQGVRSAVYPTGSPTWPNAGADTTIDHVASFIGLIRHMLKTQDERIKLPQLERQIRRLRITLREKEKLFNRLSKSRARTRLTPSASRTPSPP